MTSRKYKSIALTGILIIIGTEAILIPPFSLEIITSWVIAAPAWLFVIWLIIKEPIKK